MDNVLDNVGGAVISSDSPEIQDKKSKAVAKNVDTNKVLEYFKESIDSASSYTLDEYKKLITAAFKEASKKTSKRSSKSGDEVVKR